MLSSVVPPTRGNAENVTTRLLFQFPFFSLASPRRVRLLRVNCSGRHATTTTTTTMTATTTAATTVVVIAAAAAST